MIWCIFFSFRAAIDCLKKIQLIVQTPEGDYEPNPQRISSLKDQACELITRYSNFIETLSSYSAGPSRIMSHIKKEVLSVLQRTGYTIETEEQINKKTGREEKENIRRSSLRYWDYVLEHYYGALRGKANTTITGIYCRIT